MKEIEQVLSALRADEMHPVEAMCPEIPVSALAIAISCDLVVDALMDLTPSKVLELATQVRDKNPSLAREIEQLASLAMTLASAEEQGKTMQQESGEDPSTASSTPSADPVAA